MHVTLQGNKGWHDPGFWQRCRRLLLPLDHPDSKGVGALGAFGPYARQGQQRQRTPRCPAELQWRFLAAP